MKQSTFSFSRAFPLFLVLFLDGMGLGLVFPLLDAILVDPSTGFLTGTVTDQTRTLLFGGIVSVFMLCWFFGSAILGDLSDAIGRKKCLLICLLGSAAGYFLTALAVVFHSLSLLVLGRMIDGFTAGSQPIAQAAIVDMSDDATRARNLGYILLSISLGFIFGPMLGGILSSTALVSWFDYTTPFYFTTLLSLANAGLLMALMEETDTHMREFKLRLTYALHIFTSAFTHEKIRHLSTVFVVFVVSWSFFYTFMSMFLLKRYGATALHASFYMGLMGLGFSIGNGFLTGFCERRYHIKKVVMAGMAGCGLFVALTVAAPKEWVVWAAVVPATTLAALGYASILSLFSRAVDESHQGWVMGVTGAIMALSFGAVAIPGSYLASISVNIPIILSAIGLFGSVILMKVMIKA